MDEKSDHALDTLAAAGLRAAGEHGLDEALQAVADAARRGRPAPTQSRFASSTPRGACRCGRRVSVPRRSRPSSRGRRSRWRSSPRRTASADELPAAVQRAARRARAADALLIPVRADGVPLGSLELLRAGRGFEPSETAAARVAAAQLGLVLRAFGAANGTAGSRRPTSLALAGDALGAGLDGGTRAGRGGADRRASVRRGGGAALWQVDRGRRARAAGVRRAGSRRSTPLGPRCRSSTSRVRVEAVRGRTVATLTLGQPALGVLQLVFGPGELALAARPRPAGHLRRSCGAGAAGRRARARRRRSSSNGPSALLTVLGQAVAELSLAHTLETAVARVSELLRADRVAIYLGDANRLRPEAGSGADAELAVAERLLELAFGPLRAQGVLHVPDAQADVGSLPFVRPWPRRRSTLRSPCRSSHVRSSWDCSRSTCRAGGRWSRTSGAAVGAGRPAGGRRAERGAPRADGAARRRNSRRRSPPSASPRSGCGRCTRSRARSPRASRSTRRSRP